MRWRIIFSIHICQILAVFLLSLIAIGCSPYDRLRPVDSIPHLASLKKSYLSLRPRRIFIPTEDENGYALRMAIHEVGTNFREHVLVLIHGVLSDHEVWRFLAGDLGKDYGLLLVDLPGCGESDKPPPTDLGPRGYGVTAMARRTARALHEWLAARADPPGKISIIGHSYGGMLTIRMLGDQPLRDRYPDLFERVDRVVLLAPTDVAIERPYPDFVEVINLTGFKVWIAGILGILENRLVQAVLDGFGDPSRAPREEAEKWVKIFSDPSRLKAAQAMIRQAVPWKENLRPDWELIAPRVESYKKINVPCLILWGARDETLPLSMGYKLAVEIPGAELWIFPRCKHRPQVERPRLCASVIRGFLNSRLQASLALSSVNTVPASLSTRGPRPIQGITHGPARSREIRVELIEEGE